jgi:hypothetical protein
MPQPGSSKSEAPRALPLLSLGRREPCVDSKTQRAGVRADIRMLALPIKEIKSLYAKDNLYKKVNYDLNQ